MKVVSSKIIHIEFKVWCPKYNRINHRLLLLGAAPELGAWNIQKAPEAYPTSELHVWSVHVSIPVDSRFEWVWVKTKSNRTGAEWERTSTRYRELDCFSGVLHSIWGEAEEVFVQSASNLEISTFRKVDEGYTLVLAGSTPTSGLWEAKDAVRAVEFPKRSGYWKATVTVDASCTLNFKWTIVKEKNPSAVLVQEKEAHSVFCRGGWLRAVAAWGVPGVVVVETSVMRELSDNVMGRTEILVKEKQRRLREIKTWEGDVSRPKTSAKKSNRQDNQMDSRSLSQEKSTDTESSSKKTPDEKLQTYLSSESLAATFRRTPTVQRSVNINELSRQRQTPMSKAERLTTALNNDYVATGQSAVLRGAGQVVPPKVDDLLSDLGNQVPLYDGGVALLQCSKDVPLITPENNTDKPDPSTLASAPDKHEWSPVTKLSDQRPKETKSVTIDDTQDTDFFTRQLVNMSSMLENMEKIETRERDGIPVIQKNVAELSSVPPTWSMMVQDNIAGTCNPVIVPNRKAVKVTVTRLQQSPPQVTKAVVHKAATLFDKIKDKKDGVAIQEDPATTSGSASASASEKKPLPAPSVIGGDDMLKSLDEILEEEENRQMWQLKRQQGTSTDSKKPSTGGKK